MWLVAHGILKSYREIKFEGKVGSSKLGLIRALMDNFASTKNAKIFTKLQGHKVSVLGKLSQL